MGLTWLAIGDSITAGTGATTLINAYVYQTSKMLRQNGIPNFLINSGIGGYRSDQLLSSYKYNGGRCDPDLVTIMCGTNDNEQSVSTTTFQTNLEKIINDLRMNKKVGECIIVLCSILMSNSTRSSTVNSFNTIIQNVANSMNCTFIDTNSAFSSASYLSDTVHPNDNGHLAVANVLAGSLKTLLS